MKNIVFLCLSLFSFWQNSQAQNFDKDVQIVLLAGQSNMAGGGNYENLTDEDYQRIENVQDRVSVIFNGSKPYPLSYYKNKPGKKYNFTKRFGPELFIGVILAEKYPDKNFLLIKRSQGGTALYGAWNPNWSSEKAKEVEKGDYKQNLKLYELHIADILKGIHQLEQENKSCQIIGFGWMQGENDAAYEVSAKSYRKNLKNLKASYQRDLNLNELPAVYGQINSRYGEFDGGPDMVRMAIAKTANTDYSSSYIPTTKDLSWSDYPKHSDNVHYNAEGQKRLGVVFAEKLIRLNEKLYGDFFKDVSQLIPGETVKFRAEGTTNMVYHVYVPKKVKSTKKKAMIIAFSPAGDGERFLESLKNVADENKVLLVGCDKLKNGMIDQELERQMEDEVLAAIFKNIPHKASKVYLAGFSGGAMRSYQLTTRIDQNIAGIIAYGGWLGGDAYQDKTYQKDLKVAMVNGIDDTGANKWKDIDAETLIKFNAEIKEFSFSGGHQVAPEEVNAKVFKWILKK